MTLAEYDAILLYMTTKRQLLSELRGLLRQEGFALCPVHGRQIASLVQKLVFWNAKPSDFRGLSDTGLTAADFQQMCRFDLPESLNADLCNYLDTEAA